MAIYPAVDSNCLTYLVEAIGVQDYDPALDSSDLACERLAMARCYFYGFCSFWVPPTAQKEYERIKSVEWRETHSRWTRYLLQDKELATPEEELVKRTEELFRHHAAVNDCRMLAEVEFSGLPVLLSCDVDLRGRLQAHTVVAILRPAEFWKSLDIAANAHPMVAPAPGNPLRNKTWWHLSPAA
jgi:hypothetical protein